MIKQTKTKRVILSVVAAISMFTVTLNGASAAKAPGIVVKVNGATTSMREAPAYASQGYTMVPLRFVSEALGATVTWDNMYKQATVELIEPTSRKVTVPLNGKEVLVETLNNPVVITPAGSPAVIKNNRVMVPLRVISEGLGATVDYTIQSGGGGIVMITTPWETPASTPSPASETKNKHTTWVPTANQKVTGPIVFKPLTWDVSTRTLSFQLPSTITHENESWRVLSGYEDVDKKTSAELPTGSPHILANLSSNFILFVEIDYLPRSVGIDTYYIMSKSYAQKHYGYKGVIDNDLILYDAHKNMVTLDTVYKALGINN
ncbi:copper amine oxidase N-terminal domain-containing protein [Paenibacillus glufosinatiresistens]|uniref:copper amine oxidase N-terminal domain-containing protein n=1 Tax=Paenibacillus glufosinatiresistens TaxID=3070657 RepID=UPI00286E9D78|nr:copper amine oxidase N-terminal domain-containing protein [Paenibacillus sp. YX.27]